MVIIQNLQDAVKAVKHQCDESKLQMNNMVNAISWATL